MSFFSLLSIEMGKQTKRLRTLIGPLGLLAIVLATAIGFKYSEMGHFVRGMTDQPNYRIFGSPLNALFLARAVMPGTVYLFLPLFVSLVAGDMISGEAADGTLRMILARGVDRFGLVLAKFLYSIVYVVFLTGFLGLTAFFVGWMFFGLGGLVSPAWPGVNYFGMQEGIHRLLMSYGVTMVYVMTVASIAFLISVFANNSLVPVGATMAVLLFSGVIGQIPAFESIKPYLFTTYSELFFKVFDNPMDTSLMHRGLLTLGIYIVGSFALSAVVFTRKDILT